MIFLAVVNGQPRELALHDAIRHFINHRVDVVRRRTSFLLKKAREREHILEGYKIALDNIDQVIRIIRASGSRAEARENLRRFSLSKDIVLKLDTGIVTGPEREAGLNTGRSTPSSSCNSTASPSFQRTSPQRTD